MAAVELVHLVVVWERYVKRIPDSVFVSQTAQIRNAEQMAVGEYAHQGAILESSAMMNWALASMLAKQSSSTSC